MPEFEQLVTHEVVPGHVTTFAFLQDLYWRGQVGFEALGADHEHARGHAVRGHRQQRHPHRARRDRAGASIPDEDLQIGLLLALLQDDAKNQASYLTWKERAAEADVAAALRRDFLVSRGAGEEVRRRLGQAPAAWAACTCPATGPGTDLVADLRRRHAPEKLLPVLYGCAGLVDCTTIESVLK